MDRKKKEDNKKANQKVKYSKRAVMIVLVIAISIFIGEFGDKTFLASIGLGIQYGCLYVFPQTHTHHWYEDESSHHKQPPSQKHREKLL